MSCNVEDDLTIVSQERIKCAVKIALELVSPSAYTPWYTGTKKIKNIRDCFHHTDSGYSNSYV